MCISDICQKVYWLGTGRFLEVLVVLNHSLGGTLPTQNSMQMCDLFGSVSNSMIVVFK